jgi:hypothetical protein
MMSFENCIANLGQPLKFAVKYDPRTFTVLFYLISAPLSFILIVGWSRLWNKSTSVFDSFTQSQEPLSHLVKDSNLYSKSVIDSGICLFHLITKLSSAKLFYLERSKKRGHKYGIQNWSWDRSLYGTTDKVKQG